MLILLAVIVAVAPEYHVTSLVCPPMMFSCTQRNTVWLLSNNMTLPGVTLLILKNDTEIRKEPFLRRNTEKTQIQTSWSGCLGRFFSFQSHEFQWCTKKPVKEALPLYPLQLNFFSCLAGRRPWTKLSNNLSKEVEAALHLLLGIYWFCFGPQFPYY